MKHPFLTSPANGVSMIAKIGAPDPGVAVSPGGRYLPYDRIDTAGSDPMMVDGP